MVKVFISQPMNGFTDEEIKKTRQNVEKDIKRAWPDAVIIDSFFEGYTPSTGNVAVKFLSKSLELMADADYVFFCPGWENARGCRIEHEVAEKYGFKILEKTGVL